MIDQLAASFSEEFHGLHRMLFGKRGQTEACSVLFCASHFSEGVTSTALAFALSVVQAYGPQSVVAVEANFRKPSFNTLLGIRPDVTLADVLSGRRALEDGIQDLGSRGISVISAGQELRETELFAVESLLDNLGDTLNHLKQAYRHVIVDSPPVIPYVDATVIAGAVDKVVLIVESKVTRSEVVDRAIEKLKAGGGTVSGIILTKREFYIPRWIYRFF
jgi:Mrp family chromosome partitioning ATPase